MKKLFSLLTLLLVLGFTQELKAQDKRTVCIYKPVGSNSQYKGVIYYNLDRSGEPFLTSYSIYGIENGSGEFYDRKEYPMNENEKIGGVTYKYSMPINGAGQAYFNLACEKCRK